MRLKVLSIAYPFAPVGPDAVGGAEQILSDLDQALVAAGHDSIVIACDGSQTEGRLITVPTQAQLDEASQAACRRHVQSALDHIAHSERPDLIHLHGLDFHEYSLPEEIPAIVTLHMPISWYPAKAWMSTRNPIQFCCVSQSQKQTCPPQLSDSVVIENGVTLPPMGRGYRKNFALVLGRICPEKNAHEALEAGTQAGIPVLLAGQVFPYLEHQRYFHEKVAPLLRTTAGGVQHKFLGPVSSDERTRLLSEALCLLHPTLAPETSSLVAMEALAAGTPIIAYPSGALPEIIQNGSTGFLVNDVHEMADAIGRAATLSSRACRQAAEQRFNKQDMVRRYLDLYAKVACDARAEVLHA